MPDYLQGFSKDCSGSGRIVTLLRDGVQRLRGNQEQGQSDRLKAELRTGGRAPSGGAGGGGYLGGGFRLARRGLRAGSGAMGSWRAFSKAGRMMAERTSISLSHKIFQIVRVFKDMSPRAVSSS